MSRDIDPGTRRIMDRAWARDKQGNLIEGEALLLALLLKVKKNKGGRSDEQVAELEEIMQKPKRRRKK